MMNLQCLPRLELSQKGARRGAMLGLAIALTLGTVACGAKTDPEGTANSIDSPAGQAESAEGGSSAEVPGENAQPGGELQAGAEPFVGLWDPQVDDNNSPGLFFAGDGRAFFVSPNPAEKQAIEMDYTLDTQAEPMALDIILPGESETLKGIVEFSGEDELRLDGAEDLAAPRPESFSDKTVVFKRVSSDESLPNDVQIITKEMIKEMQKEATQGQ